MPSPRAFLSRLTLLTTVLLSACSSSRDDGHAATRPASSSRAIGSVGTFGATKPPGAGSAHPSAETPTEAPTGNAERGSQLALSFECNRCHDGTGHPAMATEKHCTHCHEDIETGRFGAGSAKIAEWRRVVAPYRYAPSLEGAGNRFRREWLVRFLQNPEDLRPNLAATMPRLGVSKEQAADLAAYLTRDGAPLIPPAPSSPAGQDSLERGRALLEAKGCGGCHVFTGAPPLPTVPTVPSLSAATDAQKKAVQLAPDLRFARERFRTDTLVQWLLTPASLKADTPMPSHSLTEQEARDLAAYLTRTELRPHGLTALPPRLPVLSRRVTYREIETRVLGVTCRHCHGNPDVAGGDGGPGNTGGFGFPPRGLDLSTYRSAAAGLMREDGQRHSLFEPGADGTPLLVTALRARQSEEAGQPVAGVRGMPLGLPAISAEDLQLVETWVRQGRPL